MDWIFFDCFNTLLDEADRLDGEHGMAPVAHLPVEHGRFPDRDAFIRAYVEWRASAWQDGTFREITLEERLLAVLGSSQTALASAMCAAFEPAFAATLTPTPGIDALLERCQGRYRMAVVSNIFVPGLPERVLTQFGLRDYFEFVVDSAELGFKKPAPEIYLEALATAGADPSRVVFVGDNLRNDAVAPRSHGMHGAWFNRTDEMPDDPVPTFSDWSSFERTILTNRG